MRIQYVEECHELGFDEIKFLDVVACVRGPFGRISVHNPMLRTSEPNGGVVFVNLKSGLVWNNRDVYRYVFRRLGRLEVQ